MARRNLPHALRAAAALAVAAALIPGCFDLAGLGDFTFREPIHTPLSQSIQVDKLDLLLVVDNSYSTAGLQEVLSSTFVDFFSRLANPPCLDVHRQIVANPGPLDVCPEGAQRESPPLLDIHVGIITSSLGGHGGSLCTSAPSQNTQAHLEPGVPDQSYQGRGFLAWDPHERLDPPGDSDLGVLVGRVGEILTDLGAEGGCGYEAQLEAWYRFLVDPDPYESIEIQNGLAVKLGTDETLLDQRAAFLRDDSVVAIVLLSDENDCSIVDGGPYWVVTEPTISLPKARAACAASPGDACCVSCAQTPPEGCDTSQDDCGPLPDSLDDINLRCFDQKRRFGFDFLYPVERYHDALTQPTVEDRDGVEVPNPLFAGGRLPGFVTFTAIVGVPWQDIARRNEQGQPDLKEGRDAAGEPVGGMLNADELEALGVWDLILGDPATYVRPSDPFMVESTERRTGTNEVVGESIAGPGDPPNGINGFDFDQWVPSAPSDLQYACIAPLPVNTRGPDIECDPPAPPNPTCAGGDRVAKGASPGLRQIDLVRRLGTRGALGSACWPQIEDPFALDYGYRPALLGSAGLASRLQDQLRGLSCLPAALPTDESGGVQCEIVEALVTPPGECTCDGPARRSPGDADKAAIDRARAWEQANPAWNCFCLIQQPMEEVDRSACLTYASKPVVNEFGRRVDAWCYVDALALPPIGDPALVALCPEQERRMVRFVGEAEPRPGATVFLDCP